MAFEKREQLNWTIFVEKTRSFCFFKENQDTCEQIKPFHNKKQLLSHYKHIDLMTQFLSDQSKPLFMASNLRQVTTHTLHRLSKGICLDLPEINSICHLTEEFYQIYQQPILKKIIDEKINLPSELSGIYKLFKFIRNYINPKGDLNIDHDPRLKSLHEKIKKNEALIREKLQKIIHLPSLDNILQYKGFDLINDHYVITIKSDHYQSSMGDIITHSKSGASLYIEPQAIKNLSEKLLLLKRDFKQLIQKICFELSQKITPHSLALNKFHQATLYLDKIQAISQVNLFFKFTKPEITSKKSLILENFFHPLLNKPIKNSLFFKEGDTGALISGPNTGGKSVCLKTIALSQLLMQLGYFVPASYARLSFFDDIYFLSGDDQTVGEGLSSFSAEIKNYLHIANKKNQNFLIIIDEIFNSTSSEEASALALGFIDQFIKSSDNLTFLSSHHSMLKNSVFKNKTLQSFHMGFHQKDNTPTYQLISGSPGSSMAIEVFDHISQNSPLAKNIKHIAKKSLHHQHSEYEILIKKLGAEKKQTEALKKSLYQAKNKFEQEKKSFKNALMLNNENKIKSLQEQVDQLKKSYSPRKIETIKKSIDHFSKRSSSSKEKNNRHLSPLSLNEIKINQFYYSPKINKKIKVTQIKGKKITAISNHIKITLNSNEIYPLREKTSEKKLDNPSKVIVNIKTQSQFSTDYNCLGMRLDEFQNHLESILQGLLLKKIPYLRVIHGHGDGILKNYLRHYLKKNDLFTYETCKNSADGATIIKLA